MIDAIKKVFSDGTYSLLAVILSFVISFILVNSMGILTIYPVYLVDTFNLFHEGLLNTLTALAFLFFVPILSALTISMIIYKIVELKKSFGKESPLTAAGIVTGLFTSSCSMCVPLVFLMIGASYSTFSAFLFPLIVSVRIVSLVILVVSFYLTANSISEICKIKKRR